MDSNGEAWRQTLIPIPSNVVNQLQEQYMRGEIALDMQPLPGDEFRAKEMHWLQLHQQELALTCAGEWIAVDGAELVAHSGDLAVLVRIATKAGHPDPFITAIPAEPIISFHA